MRKREVLSRCRELLKERPHLNSTELAQAIAGGYKDEKYKRYIKILFAINELKNNGELPAEKDDIFVLKPIDLFYDADEARDFAIEWQNWAGGQSLSYGELSEYADYFDRLGKRFNLINEFKENGVV